MKKIIFCFVLFIVSFMCVNCSTDGSNRTSFNENLVTKTWYGYNNGNWTGNHSEAKWQYTFADCEEISDTEFQVIYQTTLYFYTDMPLTGAEKSQTAELARAQCSNWNYNQITQSYKNYISTLQNGTKFYRHKIKASKYANIWQKMKKR